MLTPGAAGRKDRYADSTLRPIGRAGPPPAAGPWARPRRAAATGLAPLCP